MVRPPGTGPDDSPRCAAGHGRLCPVSTPTVAEAEAEQRRLAAEVVILAGPVAAPRTVVGLDVSYEQGSDRIAAAFPDAALLPALRFPVWRVVPGPAVPLAVGKPLTPNAARRTATRPRRLRR